MRHGHAGWQRTGQSDLDRELSELGLDEAEIMGKRLAQLGECPDLIASSCAQRALTTAEMLCSYIGYPADKILQDESLYLANMQQLQNFIRRQRDENRTVLVVGHNPGLTDFAKFIANQPVTGLTTCGLLAINLSLPAWTELAEATGKIDYVEGPDFYLTDS